MEHGARFAVVADDLTGACDSAVAFAERGLAVEVMLDREAVSSGVGVWAVSTESRELPEEDAVRRVHEVLAQASGATEVFKKIDSVFRGNTFAEIRAAVESVPHDVVVLSPAYPAMGRTVRDGVLHIREAGQYRTVDLREGLLAAGLKDVASLRVGEELRGTKEGVVLCDAESQEDLLCTVAAARRYGGRVLWIGSGGLAFALAAELPELSREYEKWPAEGAAVLFVGSDHPVTKRQIEILKMNAIVLESAIEEFAGCGLEHPVVILNVVRDVTEEQIRSSVEWLGERGVACCLMTGGDTAMLVCRALGVQSLRLTKEFAPGLPQGILKGGVLDGVHVILKSGGFGTEDVLASLCHRFVERKECV